MPALVLIPAVVSKAGGKRLTLRRQTAWAGTRFVASVETGLRYGHHRDIFWIVEYIGRRKSIVPRLHPGERARTAVNPDTKHRLCRVVSSRVGSKNWLTLLERDHPQTPGFGCPRLCLVLKAIEITVTGTLVETTGRSISPREVAHYAGPGR